MGILQTLEGILVPSRKAQETRVELKEIYCSRRDDGFIERFNTAAVGTVYRNPDGSNRQETLQKMKPGEKVRLIWDARSQELKPVVYLMRKGRKKQLFMPDCFGRLGDKVATDVCRWLVKDNIVTAARVVKIVGGTRKRPKLGCVLELSTYPAPEKRGLSKWLAGHGQ
ncbi:MAG: hypothetical protein LJE94_14035 [Deltaproteobacteria bacterium]|jgi:hypothetical protein|nr:hypothetical protein [Deltaproteobacteria bacterium]